MSDANDVLFGSGIPAAKFQHPGDTFGGPIVKLEATQMRKFDKKTNRPTDELDYWDNGDPKMQAVVTVRTQHRDASDPSDDGQRKLYISSRYQQNAVKAAVKNAGKRQLEIGGVLSLTYTHEAPSEAGPLAKFYEVTYQPPSAAAANAALGQATPSAYVQQAQQYQQPMQQPLPQQQPVQQQPQGGYYADVPPIGQLMGQPAPVQQQQPVQEPAAAPVAAGGTDLASLPPEAQALVQRMLAAQQAGG